MRRPAWHAALALSALVWLAGCPDDGGTPGTDSGTTDVVVATDTPAVADVAGEVVEPDLPSVPDEGPEIPLHAADIPDDVEPDLPPPDTSDVSDAADLPDVSDALDIPDVLDDLPPDLEPDLAPDVLPDIELDTGPAPPSWVTCDAGDEAWVRRVFPVLLGRAPTGIEEVRVFVDLIAQSDRETAARAMMTSSDYIGRWFHWLLDELRVNRVGDKIHVECYGAALRADHEGDTASYVRDHPASAPGQGAAFNMTDLVWDALVLDDLSPVWRGHLFAMLMKPLTGANVSEEALDVSRRQDFGEIFEATYLHRNVVCSGCHNSEWATTDHPDPELDRHVPIAGNFERAIYGQPGGRTEMEVYSIFRGLGVVGGPWRPWGILNACGSYALPGTVPPDPVGWDAWFIEDLGADGAIWEIETFLHQGFDALRANGRVLVDPDSGDIAGPEAFAYMVSARIANRVWRELMGYPLTLVHYFPRNAAQRDILQELTDHLVVEQWSLKTLLVDIVTHPLFNENAPIDGCGGDNPYTLPPVFNPWILEQPEDERLNSQGDALHRLDARLLIRSVWKALEWPASPSYPGPDDELFQKAIGVFVKDAEPGFDGVDFQGMLSWEGRYGVCEKPASMGSDSDWIDKLVATALAASDEAPDDPPSVADVVRAMKDRLLGTPVIAGPAEATLVAALVGSDALTTAIPDAGGTWRGGIRRLCGALLSSPQFLLAGVPMEDVLPDGASRLAFGDGTYADRCELWAQAIPGGDVKAKCTEAGLVLVPVLPPLADPERLACVQEACVDAWDACQAAAVCADAWGCLTECDNDGCAEACGSEGGPQELRDLLRCGRLAGCDLSLACGDGVCAAGEDADACPGDCGQRACLVESCAEAIDECDGCADVLECWLSCASDACRNGCILEAVPYVIAGIQQVKACGVQEGCIVLPPVCGDGVCDGDESVLSCGADCPVVCGDGVCSDGEDCAADCAQGQTCQDKCGGFDQNWACQCDGQCTELGDCCPDYAALCLMDEPECGDTECNGAETAASCPADCAFPNAGCVVDACGDEVAACDAVDTCGATFGCVAACGTSLSCLDFCKPTGSIGAALPFNAVVTCGTDAGCFQ